jgi:hypothetical protein
VSIESVFSGMADPSCELSAACERSLNQGFAS